MKNILLLMLISCAITHVKGQWAVTAPVLEQLTATSLNSQLQTTEATIQSRLNTLNTAKNTLDNYEKIKEIDKRLTEVSDKLKQIQMVGDIFKMGQEMLVQVNQTSSYINRYSNVNPQAAKRHIDALQSSVHKVEEMITMCKKILSNDFVMNDYERIRLLEDYKQKIDGSIGNAVQAKKKFSFIVGINGF